MPPPPPPLRQQLRRAVRFLAPHRLAVGVTLLLALGVACLTVFEPLVLKRIFDQLGTGRAGEPLWSGVALLGVLLLGRELTSQLQNWLAWRTRIRVQFALTEQSLAKLHRLPLSFHRKEGVGGLMTRLDRGIQGFVSALFELAFNTLPSLAYLAMAVVLMVRLDWRLALVVLAFTPLPAVIAALAAPRQIRRERDLLDRWVRVYARFNEVLTGIVTVRSFAMEEREKQRFLHEVDSANHVVVRGVAADSAVIGAQNLGQIGARVAALTAGGLLAMRGEVTAGTVVAFLGYVGGLFGPVQGLTGIYRTLRTASVSIDQVFSILDAHETLGDAPDAVELGALRGDVCFEGVRFAYPPGGDRPLLGGIDLRVREGEHIALVGPSGAGKTTLMALLCRFYDPDAGVVRVDGQDLRGVKQASLRRQIGVVLQDALLFNESVRSNIAYGRPEATMEEIVAVARAAHAHEFIQGLPEGYDTLVGERGSRLSAGERQRVAIARSLLKDPPILILDEPTSALDAESEAEVQGALSRLTRGRTTFAIAHRLSTVVEADRILVLRDGRIIEDGPHARLLEQDGYYASLVRRQTRGLLPTLAPGEDAPSTQAARVRSG